MKPYHVSNQKKMPGIYHTKENPGEKCMYKVPIWVVNVSKCQKIQLLVSATAKNVEGYENRPNDQASYATNNAHNFHIS